MSHDEFSFLKKILKNYYYHLDKYPNTLITRFYGLHKIRYKNKKTITEKKIYFIIMANVF